MFTRDVEIVNKHGLIMRKYSNDTRGGKEKSIKWEVKDNSDGAYIFDTFISCYMFAAMLGIANKRTAPIDTVKMEGSEATIIGTMFSKSSIQASLKRIYQFMILTEDNDMSNDARIKKAFTVVPEENAKEEQDHFEDYVRGGLEIMDEMFSKCNSYEDISNTIIDFIDKYSIEEIEEE